MGPSTKEAPKGSQNVRRAALCRARKQQRRSSIGNLSSVYATQADYRGKLVTARPEEEQLRPGHNENKPTDIFVYILFKKVRNIDVMRASVGVRFILALQWEAPHLKGKKVNEKNLWTPRVEFLNNDGLSRESAKSTFYPETGDVKHIIVMDGHMSNELDLHHFPWDFDDVNLLIVAEMDTFDRNCRLFWQSGRNITGSTPEFLDRQLAEWTLNHDLNFLHRLPKLPGGMVGAFNGLEFKFHLERVEGFYVVKILAVVVMLTAMSWCTMMIYDESLNIEGGLLNPSNESSTIRYLSVESFTDRINLSCAVLLACVAFQYLISENIPKTGYMTTMDNLLMTSFVTIFMGALESVLVRTLSSYGEHEMGTLVDRSMAYVLPLSYFLVSLFIILSAVRWRAKLRRKVTGRWTNKQSGVDPSLFIENETEVKLLMSADGFRQMHAASEMHLVDEVIDDVNAVDEFHKEATKILPVAGVKEHTVGRASSLRSLFN